MENELILKNRLKEIRTEKGLSQARLAELVGVSRNTISSIETGQFSPTAKLALVICIALDKKFEGSITGWLDNTTPYIEHTVKEFDTLDSLALYYYGNPVYYWIIADYNRIQDPFENLDAGLILKIPTFSSISFDGVE